MKYMGSKARFAKDILPIILKNRTNDQWFIDVFSGGMNVVDKVVGKRLANDINPYLISMWQHLVDFGWKPPLFSKEEYLDIRDNKEKYPMHVVGWVGFNCSYRGKFFNGFAGECKTKDGLIRHYQKEALANVMKQVPNLKGTVFLNDSYENIPIFDGSTVYCDPPYQNTTEYTISKFDSNKFWNWVRYISKNNTVFISEYTAPDDFECIWSKTTKSSLSNNGKSGGFKESTEKLFKLK